MTAPKATEIHVRNWDKFQHPDVARNKSGVVPWIRNYTALLSDHAYTSLTGHRRAVLHGLWLEYARSRRQLTDDTRTLSRRLDMKVTTADLEALNHAGFIHLSASRLQADPHDIHTREEKREEKRLEKKPLPTTNLQVTQPDELAERRQQRGLEINGQPVTVSQLLDELTTREAT